MTKEQTHKRIKQLIRLYQKRITECSKQWDELNESDERDSDRSVIIGENMNALSNEIYLMSEFIEDLNSLIS